MLRSVWLLAPIVALFVVLAFSSILVLATHAPDHRYTVYGTVKDKAGKPLGGVRVTATDLQAGVQESNTTDGNGITRYFSTCTTRI